MYQLYISHHPAQGKGPQLRAAMEERSKAAGAAGTPIALATQMFGPEPNFIHVRRHESLADLEAYTLRNQNDPAYRAAIAKITDCLDRPQRPELDEVILPTRPSGPVNYALRVRYRPALGKALELRQALEQRASMQPKGAVGVALSAQVAPTDGPNFSATLLFSGLDGFEAFRKANQTDPSFQSWQARLAGLLAEFPRQELYQVLISFPA